MKNVRINQLIMKVKHIMNVGYKKKHFRRPIQMLIFLSLHYKNEFFNTNNKYLNIFFLNYYLNIRYLFENVRIIILIMKFIYM